MKNLLITFLACTLSVLQLSAHSISPIKIKTKDLLNSATQTDRSIGSSFLIDAGEYQLEAKRKGLLEKKAIEMFPNIQTFKVYDEENNRNGALTISGDYVNLFIKDGSYSEVWVNNGGAYLEKQKGDQAHPHQCGSDHSIKGLIEQYLEPSPSHKENVIENGDVLRTYRFAIVTTGEFVELNGGSTASAMNVVTSSVNNLEVIYEDELAVNFELLNPFFYTNSDTDIFTPDEEGGDGRVDQAVNAVSMHFNVNNYDIGHVLHRSASGDGWSSGGVARLSSVCRESGNPHTKAGGWSGSSNNTTVGWIQLFGHEVGHMFGAQHTFNGDGGSCDDNIGQTTSYEIGSGTTIMSYNGICGSGQNIPTIEANDSYFHTHSLQQMIAHMNGVGSCAMMEPTQNSIPIVEANPCDLNYVIPKETPFILEGSVEDPDSDNILFSWEQYDEDGSATPTQGFIGDFAAFSPLAPLFRSYPPSTSPIRYFPSEDVLYNDPNYEFDVLPKVGRTVNMRLTARDQNEGGGAVGIDNVSIEISSNGPLEISFPTGGETLMAGSSYDFAWNTNGTDPLCNNVNVELSLDGGQNYSLTIAENIEYSQGMISLVLPEGLVSSDRARVRVICVDNPCYQFYAISQSNISIDSDCIAQESSLCENETETIPQGSPDLDFDLSYIAGNEVTSIERTIISTSPQVELAVYNTTQSACSALSNIRTESVVIQVGETGTYDFDMQHDFDDAFSFFSLHTNADYDPNNTCASFVGAAARRADSTGGSLFRLDPSLELNSCTEYRINFHTYGGVDIDVRLNSISGPGKVFYAGTEDTDYSYTYVAIGQSSGIIEAQSPTADFTSLTPDTYRIYGLSYKSGGATPPNVLDPTTLVDKSFLEILQTGSCQLLSSNYKEITIETSCFIGNVTLGDQTGCNPADNTFSQELTIEYQLPPSSGNLVVNGQTFPIETSPQTVTITNLESDGIPKTLMVGFDEDAFCARTIEGFIDTPENCCPIDFDLGEDRGSCPGDMIILDAGTDGETYQWTLNNSDLAISSNQLLIQEEGTYSVTVTNGTGCQKSDRVTITFSENPFILPSQDAQICEDEFHGFTVSSSEDNVVLSLDGQEIPPLSGSTFQINEEGEYIIEVINDFGCSVFDTINLITDPVPVVDLGEDIEDCFGTEVVLNAGMDGVAYRWFRLGTGELSETGPLLDITQSGEYFVTVTNSLQCTSIDQISIDLFEAPIVSFVDDEEVSYCDEDGTFIIQIEDPDTDLTWNLDGVEFSPTGGNFHVTTDSGLFTISGTNQIGCEVIDSLQLNKVATPDFFLGDDIIACIDSEVILSTDYEADAYEWTQAGTGGGVLSTTQELTVTNPGTYVLTAINGGICSGSDGVFVNFVPGPTLSVSDDESFCEGGSATLVATTNGDNIQWLKDGVEIPGATDLELEATESGTYTAVVGGVTDCEATASSVVEVFELPNADIDGETIVCNGSMVTLSAVNTGTDEDYQFLLNGSVISTAPQQSSIEVSEAGTYSLIVTSSNNCTSSDEIIVTQGPALTLSGDASFCEGDMSTLTATTTESSVVWSLNGNVINGETSTTLEVTEAGVYTAAVESDGCEVTQMSTVTVNALPILDLGENQGICDGENYTLDANTGNPGDQYQYLRDGNDLGISPNQSSIEISQEGTYQVIVTNSNNCSNSASVVVQVGQSPTLALDGATEFCDGQSTTLTATSNASTYQWSLDGELLSEAGSEIEATLSGTYSLIVSSTEGCTAQSQIAVQAVGAPDIELGDDINLCPGSSIEVSAGVHTTYAWSTGEETSSILIENPNENIQSSITYSVTVTNSANCPSEDQITAVFEPIVEGSVSLSAEGACPGGEITLTASGGLSYQWDNADGTLSGTQGAEVIAMPDATTTYTVTISDDCPNNEDIVMVEVPIVTPASVTAGPDTCIVEGQEYEMMASGGAFYDWDNEMTIVGSDELANSVVMPEETTVYTVMIIDPNGCEFEDQVEICVVDDPIAIFKEISIITPNDDGKNDNLRFPGLEGYPDNTIQIYNRWGNLIYEKDGYQTDEERWNGTFGGDALPPDTYYYVLKFDTYTFKSSITIVR